MTLTEFDIARIDQISSQGHQASDLLPLLREYASGYDLDKIPLAIERFTQLAGINKAAIRGFLIARVPALIVNHYWTKHPPTGLTYGDVIQYTVLIPGFSKQIKDGVISHRLQDVVNDLDNTMLLWNANK